MLKTILNKNKTLVFTPGVLFLLITINTNAQDISISHDLVRQNVTFFNNEGKLFENPYINVSGTAFFFDTWKSGIIEIDEHNVFDNVQLRLDLHDQQVHLMNSNGNEIVIKPGAVRKITLFDSTAKSPMAYSFQCGFPSTDNQTTKNFYQILSDGKIKFLKSERKSIKEDKDSFSGETKKEFVNYEDYYFFVDYKLQRLKKDKTSIVGLMKDKNDKVEEFVQSNKISFKSVDDIKKLVDYYNSL
ncbi:MAG TPA: hypothetical protein VKT28_19575 [Puia sp.]|nr:hypothetical protein [Puia sp.]